MLRDWLYRLLYAWLPYEFFRNYMLREPYMSKMREMHALDLATPRHFTLFCHGFNRSFRFDSAVRLEWDDDKAREWISQQRSAVT